MKLRGRPTLRFLDRYLGIPLVAVMRFKPKRPLPKVIERIGVLRTAAIGEVLLISGILSDLRKAYPNAELTMITGEGNAQMGELVARGRCRHLAVQVARPLRSARLLRKERFDVLIDTGPWPRFDALLAAMSGARYTIGFSSRHQHRHFGFDLVVPHGREVHEIDNFRALVRPLGATAASAPSLDVAHIRMPDDVREESYVVLHPWSGGFRSYMREWPVERWVQLASQLSDAKTVFLVSGSPADAPRSEQIASAISNAGGMARSIAGHSVEAMIPVLQRAMLVVGVNTSITHMASILGAPTIMLDGPTSPRRWGPLGPRSKSVVSEFPGCGYVHHGFEFDGQRQDCMDGVRVAAVVSAARELLDVPT